MKNNSVIIVGIGLCDTTMTSHLPKPQQKAVILERGDFPPKEVVVNCNCKALFARDIYLSKKQFSDKKDKAYAVFQHSGVSISPQGYVARYLSCLLYTSPSPRD